MSLDWLYLAAITLLPWLELRASIPMGIMAMGLNPLAVFFVCTSVNILLLIPLFWFLDNLFKHFHKYDAVKRLIQRTHKKAAPYVDRWGALGLMLFVAVPLPGTGAYTGALAAYLLGVKRRKAFNAIAAGVAIAGIIVTLFSMGAVELLL